MKLTLFSNMADGAQGGAKWTSLAVFVHRANVSLHGLVTPLQKLDHLTRTETEMYDKELMTELI